MSQDATKDQATTPTPKNPTAHNVLLARLHQRLGELAAVNPPDDDDWSQLEGDKASHIDRARGGIVELAGTLEMMEIPEAHRAEVAAELRGMYAGLQTVFTECGEALKQAANAVVPGSVLR